MSEIGTRQLVQALQNPSRHQRSVEDEPDDVDEEYRPSGPNEEELNSLDEEDDEDEGRVLGHESDKRMRILGSRISVPLGAQSGAFEGSYASTFAIELGSHNRRLVPLDKETWAAIDDGCNEHKYDFGDWKTDARVAAAVGKLAMHIYREFRAELHKQYKKLLEKGHDLK
ncbi:hypothetical protein MRB53_021571 [Persea americana]|uniref:Uncharacterized protein n=1 Tax=Persea americana TaxID=3435 RepID=A0ACC2L4B4_PERAE|nr:hypothetical protein MRB53_021571 [Persea americana]